MQSITPWGAFFLGAAAAFICMICWKYLASKRGRPAATPAGNAHPAAAPRASSAVISGDRGQFIAAVTAAIAAYMGTEPQGLRVHAVRRLGAEQPENRAQFVAALSAALAMAMNTEPQGLRIHSIRPL